MAEMQAVMSNAAVQQRMAALRADPELAPMFEDIQKGGVGGKARKRGGRGGRAGGRAFPPLAWSKQSHSTLSLNTQP